MGRAQPDGNAPPPKPTETTDKDLCDALRRSGYLLENRLEQVCANHGFEVSANIVMPDPRTDGPREIDLMVEKRCVRDSGITPNRPAIGATLVIECMNNPMPAVFFERPRRNDALMWVPTLFGVPLDVPGEAGSNGFYRLEDQAGVSAWQTVERYATQYCTFSSKKSSGKELMATHGDDGHGGFEKLLMAADWIADKYMNEELIIAGWGGGWLRLVRPVLVLQGRLAVWTGTEDNPALEDRGHVRFFGKTILARKRVAWVVDVLSETAVPEYLEGVTRSLEMIEEYCTRERSLVQEAFASESTRRLSLMTPRAGP